MLYKTFMCVCVLGLLSAVACQDPPPYDYSYSGDAGVSRAQEIQGYWRGTLEEDLLFSGSQLHYGDHSTTVWVREKYLELEEPGPLDWILYYHLYLNELRLWVFGEQYLLWRDER